MLAAVRTVGKIFFHCLSTLITCANLSFLYGVIASIRIIHRLFTSFTNKKRLSLFNPDQRNKKEIKVMIDSFIIGLWQSACRTSSGMAIKGFCFWRKPGDEPHGILLTILFVLNMILLLRSSKANRHDVYLQCVVSKNTEKMWSA